MAEVEILGIPQSTFVWTTRIALTEKGVPYTLTPVGPHSPEITAIHPLGRIPAMRHGDVTVCESQAIVNYIDRVFDGPALQSSDPRVAAQDEAWSQMLITAFDGTLIREYLFAALFPATDDGAPDPARIEAALPKVKAQLKVLEGAVASGAPLGPTFRWPDAWAIPILYYLKSMPQWPELAAEVPKLAAALDRALARPAVAQTLPPPLPGRETAPAANRTASE